MASVLLASGHGEPRVSSGMIRSRKQTNASQSEMLSCDQATLDQMRINSMNTRMRFDEQKSGKASSIGMGEIQAEELKLIGVQELVPQH